MAWLGLEIFPILFPVIAFITFIITYSISVGNGDVYPYFPTISDTGIYKPESNVFSLFLALSSFFGFVVVAIRYMQLDFFTEWTHESRAKLMKVNKISVVIGTIACFGALVVATFQGEGSSMIEHAIGAMLTFGGGIVYGAFQSYLTYHMVLCGLNTARMLRTRLSFTILGLIFLVVFFVTLAVSDNQKQSGLKTNHTSQQWQPGDPGYPLHVIASVSEWVMAIFLLLFFSTYVPDFSTITLTMKIKRRSSTSLPFDNGSQSDLTSPLYA